MKVVCFSEIQWQYLRTRKQQVLTRFPEDWEILFLSSVVGGRRNNFKPKRDGRITHVCIPVMKNFPQGSIQAALAFGPVRFIWNVILYIWLNVIFLVTGFHGRDRVFYVSNIYYAAVLPLLPRSLIFYDCNDDHLAFPNTPRWAEIYYRKLVLSADMVIAASRGLAEQLKGVGAREVHHIGNGVDYDLFGRAAEAGVPEEIRDLPRPVIGYVGVIAQWFDFELLDRVAAAFPSSSLALVGPVYRGLDARLKKIIGERGNVHVFGAKPYDELGAYIVAMDVCLIPLRVNRLRRVADRPNKLFEYAAGGGPIVTMKYSDDMDDLSDIIYIAETAEEFVEKVHEALEKGADSERLKDFARQNDWRVTAGEISALILRSLGKGDRSFVQGRDHEERD
ncbi:MAG: glycosyltransferase [Candidatus Krumholzibacteria bacterium]|nr:glycosyltransferase [Candidatus Krumholzibacteria bacterium]